MTFIEADNGSTSSLFPVPKSTDLIVAFYISVRETPPPPILYTFLHAVEQPIIHQYHHSKDKSSLQLLDVLFDLGNLRSSWNARVGVETMSLVPPTPNPPSSTQMSHSSSFGGPSTLVVVAVVDIVLWIALLFCCFIASKRSKRKSGRQNMRMSAYTSDLEAARSTPSRALRKPYISTASHYYHHPGIEPTFLPAAYRGIGSETVEAPPPYSISGAS